MGAGRRIWRLGHSGSVSLLAPLVVALFLVLQPSAVAAQAVAPALPLEVTAESYEPDFPKEVVFNLSASSNADIVAATLRVKQVGEATVTTTAVKVEPARQVQLTYAWDLQRYYVPPGVEVEYYWLLEDATGYELRTPSRTFTLEDDRFSWREVSDGAVRLRWYAGDEPFADDLLSSTQRALDQLSADAGVPIDQQIKVFLYANQRDFLSALRPTAQEWAGGQAFSDLGIVVAAVEPNEAGLAYGRRVLPHEVSHVVVHRMTANPYGDLPRWLDEGLAMYAEGPLEATYEQALSRAKSENRLHSVQSLSSNFPTDAQAALLSYAQSHSLVKFIVERHGPDRLQNLLLILKEGSAYNPALEAALGVDSDGLETQWREWTGAPPAPDGTDPAPTQAVPWLMRLVVPVLLVGAGTATLAIAFVILRTLSRRRRQPPAEPL